MASGNVEAVEEVLVLKKVSSFHWIAVYSAGIRYAHRNMAAFMRQLSWKLYSGCMCARGTCGVWETCSKGCLISVCRLSL